MLSSPRSRTASAGGPRMLRVTLFVGVALGSPIGEARAQTLEGLAVQAEATAGGELESYLRVLQSLGDVPLYPWTIRGFSPAELDRLAPKEGRHPWDSHIDFASQPGGGARFALLRPSVEMIYNSAFPSGGNDGAIWAGRGITSAARWGVAARYGPISAVIAPMAFWSQNADFELFPNGRTDSLRFGPMRMAGRIDLPQRFGDRPYARLDPGQSTVRLDLFGAAVGASTANQYWGPATDHPVLLGNNAAGIPHLFFGTARPLDLWIGTLHGRLVWGRLDQSPYSGVTGDGRRLMSGVIATFSPRVPEGLEIGAARFFHSSWPEGGLSSRDLVRPLEGVFKTGLNERFAMNPDFNADNQLAAVFARWVLPGTGFEIYGEFGRDDHPWDLRNLLLRPDDLSAYLVGFRKAWRREDGAIVVLRGETLNSQVSHLWRVDQIRRQPQIYAHSVQRQGHTQRGQHLASEAAFGGGATVVATDFLHGSGRWTVKWQREVRAVGGDRGLPRETEDAGVDVLHSLGVESLLLASRFEALMGLGGILDLNRDFSGEDRVNLRATLVLRARM